MKREFADRRRYVRIPMVSVVKAYLKTGQTHPVMIVDLSAGGARILTQFRIQKGMPISLTIPLFDENTIRTSGKVVWAKETDILKKHNFGIEFMGGIEFDQVNDKIQKFIQRFTGK